MRTLRSPHTWAVTFVAWSAITVLWSLSIGLGGSPDEPAHVVKAVAVADGQLVTTVSWESGAFGSSVPRTYVRVPEAYERLHVERTCWTGDTAQPASCMTGLDLRDEVDASTYVGTYPPTYYLAVGWPSRLLDPQPSMYAMRVVSALLAAALLTEGTTLLLRRRPDPIVLVAGALAVPATVLFLASSVNPNGLEVAAAFCFWAAVLASAGSGHPHRSRYLAAAAVSGAALVLIRPLGPAYVILIVAIGWGTLAELGTLRRIWASRAARAVGLLLGACAVAAIGFALVNHSYSSLIEYQPMSDRGPAEAAREVLGDLDDLVLRAWGLMGWQGFDNLMVPTWITIPWLAAIGVLASAALVVGTGRQRLGLAVLVVGCIAGPVVPSAISTGSPWQGRYMLPLLVGIPLLSGAILTRSPGRSYRRLPAATSIAVVAFCAVGYLVAHQHLMNRTVVGLPSGALDNLSQGTWNGPLSPGILFGWAVAASSIWALAMLRLVAPGRPGEPGLDALPEDLVEAAPEDAVGSTDAPS